MLIAVLAYVAASSTTGNLPDKIEVDLKLSKVALSKDSYMGISYYGVNKGLELLDGMAVPKSFGITHSTTMYLGEEPIAIACVKDPKENRFEKIWCDFSRNRKFEKDELATYAGRNKEDPSCDNYTFKGQPRGKNGIVNAFVIGEGVDVLGLIPSVSLKGSISFNGKLIELEVQDSDFDGAFGRKLQSQLDTIACRSDGKVRKQDLCDMLALSNTDYYSCSMSKTGSRLVLQKDLAAQGSISTSIGKLAHIKLKLPSGTLSPIFDNGSASIPARKYGLVYATVRTQGPDGTEYLVNYGSTPTYSITVQAKSNIDLGFGKDLTLVLSAASSGANKSFSLKLASSNGVHVSGISVKKGKIYERPKEPEVVIYGPDGTEVDRVTFQYG